MAESSPAAVAKALTTPDTVLAAVAEQAAKPVPVVPAGVPAPTQQTAPPVNVPPNTGEPRFIKPDPTAGAPAPRKPDLSKVEVELPPQEPTVMYARTDGAVVEAVVIGQSRPNILDLKIKGVMGTQYEHDEQIHNVPPNMSEGKPSLGTWFNK